MNGSQDYKLEDAILGTNPEPLKAINVGISTRVETSARSSHWKSLRELATVSR